MARSKAFALLFLPGLVSLASSPAKATTESDFIYLTLMWPGTHCYKSIIPSNMCCRPTLSNPAKDFFVEALKPYNSTTGKAVTGCSTDCCFSFPKLWEVMHDLFAYWSDVSCPSKNGLQLWEDVWCTYGTCSKLNQTSYFQRALALRKKVNLLSILQKNGIVPSSTTYYNLMDIQKALFHTLGFSTVVECNQKWRIIGDYQLYKIHICVSSDAKSFIRCPITRRSNCGSKVKFPPFDLNHLPIGSADIMPVNPIKMSDAIDMYGHVTQQL